jgi:uncharacterized protein
MNNETALITGASSGIGLHLAREFAQHGHPVILVAPVEAELQQIAESIRTEFGVEARVIAKDLELENSAREIFDELQRDGITLDILVNNAGKGQNGKFWETPLERDIEMIRLNCEAMVRLLKLFIPPMVQRGRGRILNVSSVGGFEPGPLIAVYHATKAFALSLSEALTTELADTGVTVTTLCPGPTDTDFFIKADMMQTRIVQQGNVMAPQPVATAGYKALMDGERIIVPGVSNKIMTFARRLMPVAAQAKQMQKMNEKVDPEDMKRDRGDFETAAAQKES